MKQSLTYYTSVTHSTIDNAKVRVSEVEGLASRNKQHCNFSLGASGRTQGTWLASVSCFGNIGAELCIAHLCQCRIPCVEFRPGYSVAITAVSLYVCVCR